MNQTLKRTIGLAAFILLLAVSLWVAVYYKVHDRKSLSNSETTKQSAAHNSNTQTADDWAKLNTSTTVPQIAVDILPLIKISNPFSFEATSTLAQDAVFIIKDNFNNRVAEGTIKAMSRADIIVWYEQPPKSPKGEFIITSATGSVLQTLPVILETQTQTVEIYLRPAAISNCSSVEPSKRTIVSTGDNALNFYEAAVRELLKGPTQMESDKGLVSMIPTSTKIFRVGQDQTGRYIGDFNQNLLDDIDLDCFLFIAKNQIRKTLQTVPLPGVSLDGLIMIDGKIIE